MKFLSTLLCGAFVLTNLMAPAQGNNLMLNHANLEDLPAEAQEHYTKAVAAMDHIDTITALNEMAAAAEIATQEAEIQILFLDLARSRLRMDNFGLDEALTMADRMISAYERLLNREDAPEWATMILQAEYEELVAVLDTLDERLANRFEVGAQFIEQQQAMLKRVEDAQAAWRVRNEAEAAAAEAAPTVVEDDDNVQANPLMQSGRL